MVGTLTSIVIYLWIYVKYIAQEKGREKGWNGWNRLEQVIYGKGFKKQQGWNKVGTRLEQRLEHLKKKPLD